MKLLKINLIGEDLIEKSNTPTPLILEKREPNLPNVIFRRFFKHISIPKSCFMIIKSYLNAVCL
jgi:hypothetical protein